MQEQFATPQTKSENLSAIFNFFSFKFNLVNI